jgi:hypothetical protein
MTSNITLFAQWTNATVRVGPQGGVSPLAGAAGSVTFPVTTTNFPNGVYTVTLNGAPAGVTSAGTLQITNNAGTLTLNTTTATPQGTHNMTIALGGALSTSFTLNIAQGRSVTVGAQQGSLTASAAGSVTFPVTLVNIPAGTNIALVGAPSGVSLGTTATAGGTTQVIISTTGTAQGNHPLSLNVGGTVSNTFSLNIVPAAFNVTVVAGTVAGTGTDSGVFFPNETVNIIALAPYPNQRFDRWEAVPGTGVSFNNPTSVVTSFVMPANPVTVTAVFVDETP